MVVRAGIPGALRGIDEIVRDQVDVVLLFPVGRTDLQFAEDVDEVGIIGQTRNRGQKNLISDEGGEDHQTEEFPPPFPN